MTLVKLCGLMREEDAAAANEAGPDLAGVILSPGFRRTVSHETARAIRNTLQETIPLCGVFVNAELEEILSCVRAGLIDAVQLHGSEDNTYIDALHQAVPGVSVIKAFLIHTPEDIQNANASHADLVLLDGGTGEGKGFDHPLTEGIRRPYLLAGGLNPENIAEAVQSFHPYGVDTSSGIETDRMKDPVKMKRFVETVRTEDNTQ